VAWYNGHPDHAARSFDLTGTRDVVVGNGNVARILVSDVETLLRTDIADHLLAALADSRIEEVVVLGRRGPEHAACTTPELLALRSLPGIDVLVDASVTAGPDAPAKLRILAEYSRREPTPGTGASSCVSVPPLGRCWGRTAPRLSWSPTGTPRIASSAA
jgi:ferredoxin--NADP+ reductase